ncbi:MAG: DUF262 domain-containing protein [Nitrososphaerales archaeon]
MFSIKKEYNVESRSLELRYFYEYKDALLLRPPYQRKANIWDERQRLAFLDTLCRRYYVPSVVLRSVLVSPNEEKLEVIDGQQRISTIILFFFNQLRLPLSLSSIDAEGVLVGKTHDELDEKQRAWFDTRLSLDADIITNIENPRNPEHLRRASEIFWRLQQGQPLTFMETLHSRVYSAARNFITKYSDDVSFDFSKYDVSMSNKFRSTFFDLLPWDNQRMEHLLIFTRILMLEFADGPTDLSRLSIESFIERYQVKNLDINDISFEGLAQSRNCLDVLSDFAEIFKQDVDALNKKANPFHNIRNLLSLYLLLRHLKRYYIFDTITRKYFHDFALSSDFRRISQTEWSYGAGKWGMDAIARRELLSRSLFFGMVPELTLKTGLVSHERELIRQYRKWNGKCEECVSEGKPAYVSGITWYDFDSWLNSRLLEFEETPVRVLCQTHRTKK